MTHHRARARRALAASLTTALLLASAGCTDGPDSPGEAPPSALPGRSVASAPTLEAAPAPLDVAVARAFGGRLEKQQRRRLERQVGRTLARYFDAAYLGGDYPRTEFALAGFSPGAARRAASDRDLLTNAAAGADTERVVGRVQRARLDVLRPGRFVVGLTARVRLVFVQERGDGTAQEVTVSGRLMMSRAKSGRWRIFGYDLTRSSVPALKGGR